MRKINWLAMGVLAMVGQACSADKAAVPGDNQSSKSKPAEPGDPLRVPAFAFGPYAAATPAVTPAVFVELGFFDRRDISGSGDTGIFDRRDRHVAVASTDATVQAPGCEVVTAVEATAGTLAPRVVGDFDMDLEAAGDGVWRHDKGDETPEFTVSGEHIVTLDVGGDVAETTLPDAPSYTGLQLGGVFDANLTINTNLSDVAAAFADGSADALFGDAGTGADYDVATVILHGGEDAAVRQIRCVFAAGGSVKLPAAQYQQVLPLRRITGLVAKLAVTDDEDQAGATWVARFSGQSVEDLRVP